jgi:biotin carboxylase
VTSSNRERGPVLALVESNTTGTGRMFAAAARERGLRPVLLGRRPERYPWLAEGDVDVARVDTTDAAAVATGARAAADGDGLAGLVTSSEYFVAVTARAAARLGLPGADPFAVERCRDKRRQRAALAGAAVPVPAFGTSATPEEAMEAATAIGFPVVVKPADGTGSRGVRLCTTGGEVRSHTAALLAEDHDERGRPTLPAVLVEEYVEGPELSVETFGTEVVGITAKYLGPPPWFVETGHDYPAVGLPGLDDAGRVALAALDALGLGFGPAHTEIRLGARGPLVIEVNPRLAGGRIPTLVRLATGLDLVGATVDAALGRGAPLAAPGPGHASIRFLVPSRAGRVRRIGGVAAAAAVPGVVDVRIAVRPGQRVGRTGSFLDRVGHVIAAGPTAGAVRTAADDALALLELDVEAPVDDAVPAVG